MPLRVERSEYGPRLRFRYMKDGQWINKHLGMIKVSATPILDTILDNMDRCNLDELERILKTPKYWRPIG